MEEIELAPPKANEVLVRTAFTGFCHSDLYMMAGVFSMPIPLVLGHEAVGSSRTSDRASPLWQKATTSSQRGFVPFVHCPECRGGRGNTMQK